MEILIKEMPSLNNLAVFLLGSLGILLFSIDSDLHSFPFGLVFSSLGIHILLGDSHFFFFFWVMLACVNMNSRECDSKSKCTKPNTVMRSVKYKRLFLLILVGDEGSYMAH